MAIVCNVENQVKAAMYGTITDIMYYRHFRVTVSLNTYYFSGSVLFYTHYLHMYYLT